MDRIVVFLGLISCLIALSSAAEYVTVGQDIKVKPTQSPLLNPDNKVNVTLNCTGSKSDLSYYIRNRVVWTFIDPKGNQYALTEAFYQDPKSDYAAKHFSSGHIRFRYLQEDMTQLYVFSLSIYGVNREDNGVYKCSLLSEGNELIDSKEMKLTVVNPVESVSLEIHDANHNVIASSKRPASNERQIKLTPGDYMVKCDASGSNPEPEMHLFLNSQKPYVSVSNSLDKSSEYASYKGTFTVHSLTINAHSNIQSLVCKANIAGNYYPSIEAGIALMVQIDKPTVKCSNFTASLDDKQRKLMCNVSAGENSAALKCEKLSWYLSMKNQKINAVQRWKDPTKAYDIIESTCDETNDGIKITLTLYIVKSAMFKETYFLQYGEGETAHRVPNLLHDVTVAAAGIVTPLSLLACLIMACVSAYLARL